MAIPDIEESRRIAEELERSERKRGGLGFELPLDDVWPVVGAVLGLAVVVVALVHAFATGNWGYVIGIGMGCVIWVAFNDLPEQLEQAVDFVRDDYEGFKDTAINWAPVVIALFAVVSGIEKGLEPFAVGFVAFVLYIFSKGAVYATFFLLELAVENWWAVVGIAAIVLVAVFK